MKKTLTVFILACLSCMAIAQDNVIDEIVWVVGDEAILRSDVETQRLMMQTDGISFDGDPYCIIPEQLAIQKLYLNQAQLDSITVNESMVIQQVDQVMNYFVTHIGNGSKEKVEEYFNKRFTEIRDERLKMEREQAIIKKMQETLVGEIKLTPSEVRKYYNEIPKDSLPNIPTTVEVQIITREPKIPIEEVDAIKARLRDYTEQVNSGKMEFSTLARMYSEDPLSAVKGGELGFQSKTSLIPEFANVAFNLNDTKRVSNIVETDYGFHIIQLIEKRGDRVNVRHILLKPEPSETELQKAKAVMDTIYTTILKHELNNEVDSLTFDNAAYWVSSDKNTRLNKGLMVNTKTENPAYYGTPRFEMHELPQEVAKVVDKMKVGEISEPFEMIDDTGKKIIAFVKLKAKTEAHKANLADDYQTLKAMVESKKRTEVLDNWIRKKQKTTYVRISDGWKNCDFRYPDWIKE